MPLEHLCAIFQKRINVTTKKTKGHSSLWQLFEIMAAIKLPYISNNAKKGIVLTVLSFLILDALFFGFFAHFLNNIVESAGGPTIINRNAKYAMLPGRPAKGKRCSIAILTSFPTDGYGQELRKLTWSNKQKYAAQHGYDIYDINTIPSIMEKIDASREKMHNFYYWKYVAISEMIKGGTASGGKQYDWVVWVDSDAIFLNFSKRYEDIIDERYDVIVTTGPPDHPKWGNIINAGSLIVRNSEFGQTFLSDILNMSQSHCGEFLIENPEAGVAINGWIQVCNPDGSYWLADQGIILALYTYKSSEYKCHFKKTWFRAFNSEFPWYGPGDLMVHFPGRNLEDRRRLIKAFNKFTNFRNGIVDNRYTDILDADDTLTSDLVELEQIYGEVNPVCDA